MHFKTGSLVSVFEITHSAAEFPMKKIKTAHFEAKRKLYKLSGQERVKINIVYRCRLLPPLINL